MADPFTWFIVSTIAQVGISYLFPAEGPRMRDLRVSASTYGATIPIVFGTARVAGNLIWSAGITEKKQKKKAGKGGGYYNEYTYYASCAYAFCQGPVTAIMRIWADSKLIYSSRTEDKRNSTSEQFQANLANLQLISDAIRSSFATDQGAKTISGWSTKFGNTVRNSFYLGTEEQLPDPVIEAIEGVNNVPAYRGLCYMVVKDFPLADFGNRIPQCAAEVLAGESDNKIRRVGLDEHVYDWNAEQRDDDWTYYDPSADGSGTKHIIDWSRSLMYGQGRETYIGYDDDGNVVQSNDYYRHEDGISVWDMVSGKLKRWIPASVFIPREMYSIEGDGLGAYGATGVYSYYGWWGTHFPSLSTNTDANQPYFRLLTITPDGLPVIEYSGCYAFGEAFTVRIATLNPYTLRRHKDTMTAIVDDSEYEQPVMLPEEDREQPVDLGGGWIIRSPSLTSPLDSVCKTVDGKSYLLHISEGYSVTAPVYYDMPWSSTAYWRRYYIIDLDRGQMVIAGMLPYQSADYFLLHGIVPVHGRKDPTWYVRTQYYNVYDGYKSSGEPGHLLEGNEVVELPLYRVTPNGWEMIISAAIEEHPQGTGQGSFPAYWYGPRAIFYDVNDPGVITIWWNGGRFWLHKWSEDTEETLYNIEYTEISPSTANPEVEYSDYNTDWDNAGQSDYGVVVSGVLYDSWLAWPTTVENFVKIHTFDTTTGAYKDYRMSEPCQILALDPDDADTANIEEEIIFDGEIGYYDYLYNSVLYIAPDSGFGLEWSFDTITARLVVAGRNPITLIYDFSTLVNKPLSLGDIVERLLRLGGLKQRDFNLGPLYDVPVTGYGFANITDIRAIIDDLRRLFVFDLRESNGQITASIRGDSEPVETIPQALLGGQENSAGWLETRVQEAELPERVQLVYMNYSRDFENATATSKRITNPMPSMFSRQQFQITSNAIFTPKEAKQRVTKMLYTQWLERTKHDTVLPWAFLTLDPGDTVTVNMDDGRSYIERIQRVEMGADLNLATETFGQDSGAYEVIDIEADGGNGPTQPALPEPGVAIPLVYNGPLLRDADDAGGGVSMYYTAVGSVEGSPWRNGTLWRSVNNLDYEPLYSESDEAEWAITTYATPAPLYGIGGIDWDTEITLSPQVDWFDLSSITTEELWAGGNPAILGGELIQFRDAVQAYDGSWIIKTLLRGRRGTEYAAYTHDGGESFITLDPLWITGNAESLDAAGQTRWFAASTAGVAVSDVVADSIVYYPRDLMPYSPVHIEREFASGFGSNITISWTRRTRTGGGWQDAVGDVPLKETVEAYEVYILGTEYTGDPSMPLEPAEYLRLYHVTGATEIVYTASEQGEDGFDAENDTLYVVVFQISGTVGRGFPGVVAISPIE